MRILRATRLVVAIVGLILVMAACSGSDEPGSVGDPVTTVDTPPTTTESGSSVPASSTTAPADDDTTTVPSLLELRGDLGLDILVLNPITETGSHPTLNWQPADGAAAYWLVLRDAGGRPYWAWTGTDTSVRVGGGDSASTNQTAALHAEMTWSVAAFDEEGNLIALSDSASVAP